MCDSCGCQNHLHIHDDAGHGHDHTYIVIPVKGMSCQACADRVTKALSAFSGVSHIEVDVKGGAVSFAMDDDISIKEVKEAINKLGFEA